MLSVLIDKIPYPLIVGIQLICAWSFLLLLFWSAFQTITKGITRFKKLHEIPCSNCTFFTNDYHLKCTVHPSRALSEDAIGCRNFEPRNYFSINKH